MKKIKGLITYLNLNNDIEVVGEASNSENYLLKAIGTKPDVILLDVILLEEIVLC